MTTCHVVAPARTIELTDIVARWSWPMKPQDTVSELTAVGWTPHSTNPLVLTTAFDVTPGIGMITTFDERTHVIRFALTDISPSDDVDAKASLVQDVFAQHAHSMTQAWQQPKRVVTGPDPELWWSVDRCAVRLWRAPLTVVVHILTPEGTQIARQVGDL